MKSLNNMENLKWYDHVIQTGVLLLFIYGIGLVVAVCNHEPKSFYIVVMCVSLIGIIIGTIFEYRDIKHDKSNSN